MTRFKYIRMQCGFSLTEVADAAGLSAQHISRIELLDVPATPGHEQMCLAALLKLMERKAEARGQMRDYCLAHNGHLLDTMEENPDE